METLTNTLQKLLEKGEYFVDPDNKVILTKEHLGETIASNYEASLIALDDKSLLNTFKVVDIENFNLIMQLQENGNKPALVIFYLQYSLNPTLPFSYKEYVFKDVRTLGQMLFDNEVNVDVFKEIIHYKLLSYYLKFKGIDTVDEKLYNTVLLAESLNSKDLFIQLKLIAYALSGREYYEYGGHKFTAVEDLYDYLLKNRKMIRFSRTFKTDYDFMGWLIYLGKYEIIKKWADNVNHFEVSYEPEGEEE